VRNTDKIREGGLEGLDLAAKYIMPVRKYACDRGINLGLLREIAGARIGLGDYGERIF
jgi:hypothetical protein